MHIKTLNCLLTKLPLTNIIMIHYQNVEVDVKALFAISYNIIQVIMFELRRYSVGGISIHPACVAIIITLLLILSSDKKKINTHFSCTVKRSEQKRF